MMVLDSVNGHAYSLAHLYGSRARMLGRAAVSRLKGIVAVACCQGKLKTAENQSNVSSLGPEMRQRGRSTGYRCRSPYLLYLPYLPCRYLSPSWHTYCHRCANALESQPESKQLIWSWPKTTDCIHPSSLFLPTCRDISAVHSTVDPPIPCVSSCCGPPTQPQRLRHHKFPAQTCSDVLVAVITVT